jgi:hypothetical protein
MQGNNIEVVFEIAYFGIILENTGSWEKHKKKLRREVIRFYSY